MNPYQLIFILLVCGKQDISLKVAEKNASE